MKRKIWKRVAAIGVASGMLITSMPVMAFDEGMIVEDDSYIVAEDDTEAVLAPEPDDDVKIIDDNLVVEEGETEIGDQEIVPSDGFFSEEDEDPSVLTAADESLVYHGMYYMVKDNEVSITGVVPDIHYKDNGTIDFEDTCWLTSVDIPENIDGYPVTEIGKNAFANCVNLSSVSLPATIETVRCGAFKNCISLQGIEIPFDFNTDSSMGFSNLYQGAFYGCSSLRTVEFGETVTQIPKGLFYGCTGLEEIILPETVKRIEEYAFRECSSLEKTTILSTSLEYVGLSAFEGCTSLTTINIPEIESTDSSMGFSNLYRGAFYGCSSLRTVEFGETVTQIPKGLFYGCTGLEEIILPETVKRIEEYAFRECSSLEKTTILSTSLEYVGLSAFEGCTSLTTINIPEIESTDSSMGFSNLYRGAFYGCSSLRTVEFGETVTQIPKGLFYGCTGLEEIILPETVKRIEEYAFRECSSLEKTTILSTSLEYVGLSAFEGCTSLTTINIPEIESTDSSMGFSNLYRGAFYGCSSLRTVEFGETVTQIPKGLFYGCTGLEEIILPETVKRIEEYAFRECSSLEKTTILSTSLEYVGLSAFEGCTSLTTINIPEIESTDSSMGFSNLYRGAFYGCSSLRTVEFGETVTQIPKGLFYGCTGLEEIILPETVKRIEEYAFRECTNLLSITIPASVTSIATNAFNNHNENLTIYGYTGSYAETYALENNIPFVAIDGGDTPQGFHHTLDYYATTSSTTYNPELACDLMKLAWDAYGPNTEPDEHNVGTDEDILADYGKLGFTEKYSKNYSRWQYFNDYCGFSFAAKDANDGGQIVVITIRGTVGGIGHLYDASPEWISDLLPTVPAIAVTGWHRGLYNPACDIVNALDEKGLINTTNTKYFITGHSRGAGVGNVLAVLLSQRGVSRENLYDYNFACPDTMYAPAGTSWSGSGRYNNIFNITAANDLVGVVPGILGYSVGLAAQLLKRQFTVHTWGKYGKTYYYSFDWNNYENSAINPFSFVMDQGDTNPHQPSLYYQYLSKLNNTGSFKSYADVKINNLSYATSFLKCFTGFCPVDMTIVDGKGVDIVSVTNGEVIYHNNYGMKDAIVMTDGDFKAFFVDPSIDCKVKIKATDSGEMAFVSSLVNINTEEIKDEKHFENVTLENGKTFISEGLSKTDAGKVKLYTTDSKGNKVAEVNSDGKETKIVKRVTPKKASDKITVTKKPSIKKPAAAKGKVTVKWKHFKHTSKKTKKIWKKIKKVQIQCATDKAFKNIVKTATVKKSKTSAKIKGLKKKTTYYVRVRYFDGTGYSAWSKVKKVKTK